VRAGGFFTFDNVPSYLKFFYPHLAQVVLISPLIDSEALGAAAEIARSDYELLVVSPNPVDFSPAKAEAGAKVLRRRNRSEGERTLRISVELAELARNSNLAQLRNAGIFVLDWRKDDQLDHTFSKNLRAWSRQVEWTRSKATQGVILFLN
jgi:hypothetical protein